MADEAALAVAVEEAVVGDQRQPGAREERAVVEPADLDLHALARPELAVLQQRVEALRLGGAEAVDARVVVLAAQALQLDQRRVQLRAEGIAQRAVDADGILFAPVEDDVRPPPQCLGHLFGRAQQLPPLGLLVDGLRAVPEPFGADDQDGGVRLQEVEQAAARGRLLGPRLPFGHRHLAALDAAGGELAEGVEGADGVDAVAEELDAHRLGRAVRVDVQDAAAQAVLAAELHLRGALVAVVDQPLDQPAGFGLVLDGHAQRPLAQVVGAGGGLQQGGDGRADDARAGGGFQEVDVGRLVAVFAGVAEGEVTQHAQPRAEDGVARTLDVAGQDLQRREVAGQAVVEEVDVLGELLGLLGAGADDERVRTYAEREPGSHGGRPAAGTPDDVRRTPGLHQLPQLTKSRQLTNSLQDAGHSRPSYRKQIPTAECAENAEEGQEPFTTTTRRALRKASTGLALCPSCRRGHAVGRSRRSRRTRR